MSILTIMIIIRLFFFFWLIPFLIPSSHTHNIVKRARSFCIIFVVLQEAANIIPKMDTLLTGFRGKVVWGHYLWIWKLSRRQAACNLMQRLSCPIVIFSEQTWFSNTGEVPEVLLSLWIYVRHNVTTNPSLDLAKFLILLRDRIYHKNVETKRIFTFRFRKSVRCN